VPLHPALTQAEQISEELRHLRDDKAA